MYPLTTDPPPPPSHSLRQRYIVELSCGVLPVTSGVFIVGRTNPGTVAQ